MQLRHRAWPLVGGLLAALAAVAAPAERGAILEVQELRTLRGAEAMMIQLADARIGAPEGDAIAYKVIYSTITPSGEPTRASGLVALPTGLNRPLPIASWQHGTTADRDGVPSRLPQADALLATAYATYGYVYVAADYLGLGDSPGLHPYCHAESEASACIDLLRAARLLADEQGVELSGQLFLFGYSQGGHATMALHRVVERDCADEFTITASAPMAGPYDMSDTMLRHMLGRPSRAGTFYTAYLLAALLTYEDVDETVDDVFVAPYAAAIGAVMDGTRSAEDLQLPPTPRELIQPAQIQAIENDPNHPFITALRQHNLYDWKPVAPVRLYSGGADQDVPIANSELAARTMKALGAEVELINVGANLDHGGAALPSILGARLWFDTLRTR